MLHVPLRLGSSNQTRIVLVHGFTQAGEVWRDLAERWSDRYEVVAPDLPGHGRTSAEHDTADLWEAGRLLGEAGGRAIYVGYSLGGRTLLHLALSQPELVQAMVVVGAKAGFDDRAKADARTVANNALADRIEAVAAEGRLDEFIDEWLQHPVNIRLPEEAKHRALRLQNRAAGMAASLRHAGSGPQEALRPRLHELTMPTLVMFAEHDTPVILQDNADIADAVGHNATTLQVPGVGHSIPFEAPEAFADAVDEFLRSR